MAVSPSTIAVWLCHLLALIFLPPLLLGVIAKVKAFFAGRKGPPLFQLYRDIGKLLAKELVISNSVSSLFSLGPLVSLAAVFIVGLLLPFGPSPALISFNGDMILFAYLLGLTRFFTTVAALDTGSSFEGMGSARETTFACITEPSLFFAFIALAKASASLNLASMLGLGKSAFSLGSLGLVLPILLMCCGLFAIMLAENSRIPVDDPTTHLELTMIHEAMILDHSGPLLGIIEYTGAMKLLVYEALLLSLALPFGTGYVAADFALFILESLVLAALIGVVESHMARLRMRRVPYLLTGALLFCASGFALFAR